MNEVMDDIIIKYLNNKCSKEEKIILLEWLESDIENKKYLFELEEIDLIRQAQKLENSLQLDHSLNTINAQIDNLQSKRRILHIFSKFKYVAILFILLSSTLCLWKYFDGVSSNYIQYTVSNDEPVKEFVLSDGTTVWLNRGSILTVFEEDENERNVKLSGEAYFKVAHDKERPFRVHTDYFTVKVLGTIFNVKSFASMSKAEAVLVEGKVEIESSDRKRLVTLSVGQRVRYDKKSGQLSVNSIETGDVASWREGYLTFTGMNIQDIFEELSCVYQVPIIISESGKSNILYSGVIKRSQNINNVIEDLRFVFPFTYKYTKDSLVITPLE